MLLTAILTCFLLAQSKATNINQHISHIWPRVGSLWGGTRVTLYGVGFSEDQFSFGAGNEHKGNKVTFTSDDGQTFNCPVELDHQSNEYQIVCDTPSHLPHDVYFYVSAIIDGVEVPSDRLCPDNSDLCAFRPHYWWTPTVTSFSQQTFSTATDAFITATGKIATTRFGSNTGTSPNGVEDKITRVYRGGNNCDLQDSSGTFYGLALDNDDSYNGKMTCKIEGTYVGYGNFSYLVDGPYGRSKTDTNLYHVSPHSKIYSVQTYSEVTSITPSSGSTEGGTVITVYGYHFEDAGLLSTYAPFRIDVGGVPCTSVNVVQDQYATCTTPAQPSGSEFTGGRGMDVEYWSTGSFADNEAIRDAVSPTGSMYIDNSSFCGVLATNHTRMTMFLKAPSTGDYTFRMKATGGGAVFIDGTKIVTSTGNWASSDKRNLVKDTYYKLIAVASPSSDSSGCVEVSFRYFNTLLLNSMTGRVTQESQTVKLESPVVDEELSLKLSAFSSQSKVNEKQKICPSGKTTGKLGLYGVYTLNEVDFSEASDVAAALTALPFVETGESFACTANTDDSTCLDCTFTSTRGNIPDISTITDGLTLNITEVTAGVPNNLVFSLMYGGVPSSLATYDNSDTTTFANTIKEKLEEVFSVRCPSAFNPSGAIYQGYEGSNLGDKAVTDVIPFCGRASYKNPSDIFPVPGNNKEDFSLGFIQWLCLAVKGLENSIVYVNYETPSGRTRNNRQFTLTTKSVPESEGGWKYGCINLMTAITEENSNEVGTPFKVKRVYLKNTAGVDFYIDEVMFGQTSLVESMTDLTGIRLGPGSPNPTEMVLVKEVAVEYDDTLLQYNITITPHHCGSKFDLLTLANADLSGSITHPTTSVTSTLTSGTGKAVVESITRATPALKGTFKLAFEGTTAYTSNIDVQNTDTEIKSTIEASSNIGTVKVESSSASTCANRDIYLTYESLAGDRPLATLTSSLSEPSGATATVAQRWDGFLEVGPIMGDYTRRVKSSPQVEVFVNDVISKCEDGVDCTFAYSSADTPTLTGQSISSGSSGQTLTLDGTLLSDSASVMIGGVACTGVTGSATSISCTLGDGPIGQYDIIVDVPGKGLASSSLQFNYTAGLSGISPNEGSLGGGMELTLTGFGFSDDSEALVDGVECAIVDLQIPTTIVCVVPPYSTLTATTDAAVDVTVKRGGQVQGSAQTFTYKPSLTTTITSLSYQNPLKVSGGETVTIGGTNFGSNPTVTIGGTALTIDSSSTTSIVATTPVLAPGQGQDLIIDFGNGASLYNDAVPQVDVTLRVDNVYPLSGSLLGGTTVTATGLGFGTAANDVELKFGETPCVIDTITNTQIVCDIAETGQYHYISNEGTTGYGIYFAFNASVLNIKVGDRVKWTWMFGEGINNVQQGIYETSDLSLDTVVVGGINSGTAVRTGQFEWQFTKVGTYYIWSGPADSNGIRSFRMTIEVEGRTSSSGQMSLTLKGHEATHNLNGASDPSPSGCALMNSDIDSCSPETVTHADATKFNFVYANCRTPTVTALTFTNASSDPRSVIGSSELTVTGTGFSDANACTNEVKIGDCASTVTVDSVTSFTFQVDSNCDYPIGQYQALSLDVIGYGFAHIDIRSYIDSSVVFVPEIEAISPSSGSSRGGTTVTLQGSGLSGATLVRINGVSADFSESSGDLIVTTPPYPGPLLNAGVDVEVYVGTFPSTCSISGGLCRFTYSSANTPTLTAVDVTEVSGTTTLVFTGTNLGTVTGDVTATIAGETCTVSAVSTTSMTCQVSAIPHGTYTPHVLISGLGSASVSSGVTITGLKTVTAVTPTTGSIHGGTDLTFTGHGFNGTTTVSVGNTEICTDVTVTLTQVMCTTLPHAAGSAVDVVIESNGGTYPSISFTFETASTPTISGVSPTTAASGDSLTISGTGFGTVMSSVSVYLGTYECTMTSVSDTSIECTLGTQTSGSYDLKVLVDGKGFSNTSPVTYQIGATGISPQTGTELGNQLLTISGSGFTDQVITKVCDNVCTASTVSASSYVCVTPAKSGSDSNCAVTVQDGASASAITAGTYVYTDVTVPQITGISPSSGGTGGGTLLTISGTSLSGTSKTVSINGVPCVLGASSATEITCTTGAHTGTVTAPVVATIDNVRAVGVYNFDYRDSWSSTATWGGGPLPVEGDFVVIPSGQTIMLDQDTPILAMLLIQGALTFDPSVADLTLNAKSILIMDGGRLQAGTENEPFEGDLTIELHGHTRDTNLPIYGTKNIAVREGTLDLHGKVIPTTWTRLESTAAAGSTQLTVQDALDGWNVGDQVVIATTGDRHSQGETEVRTISAISANKKTLTFTEALEYEHKANEYSCVNEGGSLSRDLSGEVGLLTRNIVVRGNDDPDWNDQIEACPDGFDTGEFKTQTCFQGRFGEETSSTQFGAQIILHGVERDTQKVIGRLSYVEVTFAGQAFQLGRYPIHFHLNGDMNKSYVKGCAIHKTFNRAINIHGSHNIRIEDNVGYNIMGGAFFLEDGIETGNIYEDNLLVFVRQSTSLLNDDITPAAFWATNANNTYRRNAVAGGTHFGWWYRMHQHPDGPSFTNSICPQKVPLGEFSDNTVHSCGWFGLWVFEDFYPMEGGGCNSNTPQAAIFNDFTVWNCEKGTEFVNAGLLVMNRAVLVNNDKAGFEWKLSVNTDCSLSPNVKDSCISGKINAGDAVETNVGVKVPYGPCFWMENVTIEHVPIGFQYTEIQGTCSVFCNGFTSFYDGITHSNDVTKDIDMRWVHEGVLTDMDGSLCGTSDHCQIIQNPGTHIPSSMECSGCSVTTKGLNAMAVLPSVNLIRVAMNKMSPASTAAKNISFANQYGSTLLYFNDKRLTHKDGWMGVLVGGETYYMTVVGAEQMTNISFDAGLYGLESGVCLIWCLKVQEKPDRTTVDGSTWKEENNTFTCSDSGVKTGDWYYGQHDGANWVCMAFIGESSRRRRRGLGYGPNDISLKVQVQKCFYDDCIPPLGENDPPVTQRPDDYVLWNNTDIWYLANGVYFSNRDGGGNASSLPTANSDVIISKDARGGRDWVVLENFNPPALGTVMIEGGLEIDYLSNYAYSFEAKNIIIFGGHFVVGWPDDPIIGTASITLAGDMNSPWYTGVNGFSISNKALGAFGGLDLHGPSVGDTWARLGSTAAAGSRVLTLESGTDISGWQSGDSVFVTSSSPNLAEAEEKIIASVDSTARTVTLTSDLAHNHFVVTETVDGVNHVFAAAVGLLTRRIKVQGEDIERWGGRILVSVGQKDGDNVARSGFIRATYVEFSHMGQEGFTGEFDPRYAIAVVASSKTDAKPTNITKCSFHHLHNSAIGVYGSENIPITDNVVYKPVGNGIAGKGAKNMVVEGNLVSNMQWTGAAYGRNEAENIRWEANFRIMECPNLTFKHNYAAGSQRIGFRVGGEDCDSTPSKFENNFAVGNLFGVGCFKDDKLEGAICTRWEGYTTWNNFDYGIYYNNANEFEGKNNVIAHETTGMFVFIFGPSPLSQVCSDKEAKIYNSTFIGSLSGHSCASYTNPSGVFVSTSGHCRGRKSAAGSRLGVVAPIFSGGPNNSPLKPCGNIMSYNALCGRANITDNKFKNFGPHSSCGDSFVFAASPSNDDANHPVLISSSTVENVDSLYRVIIPRPNKNKINPSDCVDMDCDGLKKALFEDTDGTFSGGSPATWISHSEWLWSDSEQTASRGLGDYRIPTSMLTGLGGNRLDPDSVASNGRGIIRDNTCTLQSVENTASYKCDATNYEMLVIESLDGDTEMRRLSPVAIESGGYLDLINGPQDHGWCAGYTCQKRISTFIAMVRAGEDVTIFLTSTEPEKIRFFLIHADPSACVLIGFYYTNPNRIDAFINDGSTYVLPSNGEMKDGVFGFKFDSSIDYKPSCSDPSGTNYIDRNARMVYFVLKGGDKIQLVRANVVVMSISLPAMTETEFFGSNVIENLASMLGIPLNKIRIVSIVAETVSGRRKRSTSGVTVTAEIGEAPAATADETDTGANTQMAAVVANACQTDIDSQLGTTNANCNNISVGDMVYTTAVPAELRFEQPLTPQHEGVLFTDQPTIRAYDSNNLAVPSLGIDEHAWEITATIRTGTGHSDAVLGGTTTITAVGGWFNFTDLTISHAGNGYIIDFDITAPAAAVAKNLSLPSAAFDLSAVPMTAGLYAITAGTITQNNTFSLTLDLRDSTTNQQITNITWRGHTFTSNCDLALIPVSGDIFTGTLTQTFDNTTGTAVYNDLRYTGKGFIGIACQIESSPSPAEFSFTFYQGVIVLSSQQANIVVEKTSNIVVRFLEDFTLVVPTEAGQMQLLTATLSQVTGGRDDIRMSGFPTIRSGSIIVTFTVEGSTSSIELMQSELCSNLSSGLEVTVGTTTLTLDTFMTVDGADFYSTCGTTSSDDDDDDLHPAIIALIVCVCVLVLIILGLLLLWKFKILPKTKTHDNGRTVFLGGPQQKVEDIFYKQKNRPDMRPPSSMAAPVTTLYDELDINNVTTRKSPLSQEGLYKEDTMTRPGN